MIVHLDAASPVPAYEQLRAQIAASIVAGHLAAGHQLPPIRQLAKDLKLAPGTVARAYRELEAAGLVDPDGRRGTRVAPRPAEAAKADDRLREAADAYAEAATRAGATPDEATRLVQLALTARAASPEGRAVGT